MEEKLMNKLMSKVETGETLLWSGRPEEFEYMDKTHAAPLKKKTVLTLLVGLAIIGGYIMAAINNHADIKIAAIALIAGFVFYTLIDSKLEVKKLKNKVMYGLTDQRMFIVVGETVFSVDYSAIEEYKLADDEDGHTTLLCGPTAMSQPAHLRRTATVIGTTLNQSTGVCDNFAMYALPEVEPVKKILAQYVG